MSIFIRSPSILQYPTADNLWAAVVAFEGYPLKTTSGLEFSYRFKVNRHGRPGNELQISRKAKTITRSSVEMALTMVIDKNKPLPVRMTTPKELGVFGASYIYPLFIRLGLVEHVGSNRRGGRKKKSKPGSDGELEK